MLTFFQPFPPFLIHWPCLWSVQGHFAALLMMTCWWKPTLVLGRNLDTGFCKLARFCIASESWTSYNARRFAWVPGYLGARVPRYLRSWVPWCLDTWVHGCMCNWVSGCLGTKEMSLDCIWMIDIVDTKETESVFFLPNSTTKLSFTPVRWSKSVSKATGGANGHSQTND